MPYGPMDLAELVKLLGMDYRRVEKMAQRGQIPCQKVGGTLRFNRAEITEWLQQHMSSMDQLKLEDMDAGMTAHREILPTDTIITPMLHAEAICTHMPARTKNSAIKELALLADKTGLLYDMDTLVETLTEREELCSTAMEGGIAIPHPRRPQPYMIAEPILVVAKTSSGIGYGAPDGKLTDLFFLTCSMDDRYHLHVLARLCRMLQDNTFIDDLRHAQTNEEIIDLMTKCEQSVLEA